MSDIKKPHEIIWVKYYAPKTLDDLLVPDRIKNKLKKGLYNHFLFYGAQGTGKTSTAEILSDGHAFKYINASLGTGVKTLENDISEFASTVSLDDEGGRDLKVVILDELDGVSDQFLKAFRGAVEKFSETTRFIATCNHFENIPDPIKSRFECINFNWDDEEEKEVKKLFVKKIWNICKENGMSIDKDALKQLVHSKFPDLRSIISMLQGYYTDGIEQITTNELNKFHGAYKELFDWIFTNSDPVENYKYLGQYQNKVDDIIQALGSEFIDYIELTYPQKAKDIVGDVCMEVNRHSYESRFVIDPFVTLLSLVFKLQQIVQNK